MNYTRYTDETAFVQLDDAHYTSETAFVQLDDARHTNETAIVKKNILYFITEEDIYSSTQNKNSIPIIDIKKNIIFGQVYYL